MKAKGRLYTAHLDYNKVLDIDVLNTKIRITDSEFDKTGIVFYEGTVCKFLKERIPTESLVDIISQLKYQNEITYRFSGGENKIEKVK